jgi:D-glycero-alpha-D-manno-heptose-7-phosphate kinase
MIISETPLRMSFVGGGSDLPAFYRRHGGAVVSTAIDKYVYLSVNKKFDDRIRVSYSQTEDVETAAEVQHQIVRATLLRLGIAGGLEITSVADIPSRGTGLGSSSSFTVGLLHALHAYRRHYVSPQELAAESCQIELELCADSIGKQDQYAAAYGGLNTIYFHPDDTVSVEPIVCDREITRALENSLISFYTGLTRSTSALLSRQAQRVEEDASAQRTMCRIAQLAHTLRDELRRNHLDAFGEILHEGWMLKREMLHDISTPEIDGWYERARRAGASGGKLLGAGGGGFLVFFARPERHAEIEAALPELRRFDIGFDPRGSRIILFHK